MNHAALTQGPFISLNKKGAHPFGFVRRFDGRVAHTDTDWSRTPHLNSIDSDPSLQPYTAPFAITVDCRLFLKHIWYPCVGCIKSDEDISAAGPVEVVENLYSSFDQVSIVSAIQASTRSYPGVIKGFFVFVQRCGVFTCSF